MNDKFEKFLKVDTFFNFTNELSKKYNKMDRGYLWVDIGTDKIISMTNLKYDYELSNIVTIFPFKKENYGQ